MEKNLKKELTELTGNLDQIALTIWACNCAEHVLHYFEEKYPQDDRPRKAIDAGRAWIQGKMTVGEARTAAFSAHAAARATLKGVARAVARSAGHAAATAHLAGHAIHAANYAASELPNEREWQYQQLLVLL